MNKILTPFVLVAMLMTCGSAFAGYYVKQGKIYRGAEQPVQFRGVSWFGFETQSHVPHGLWARNWLDMIEQMHQLGINAVRLPVCPGSLHGAPTSGIDYKINPKLKGKNSLQLLDLFVRTLNRFKIHILIDHHTPDCKTISPLWYTRDYSEKQWLDDLQFIAKRYRDLPYFAGIEPKNEPHGTATWGKGEVSTDWDLAAARAADAILAVAPDILIFVAGLSEYPPGNVVCPSGVQTNWGGSFAPLACVPLHIARSRLILAPHIYGPKKKRALAYFKSAQFPANLTDIWQQHFGRFIDAGYAVVPTEFGGPYKESDDARNQQWQDSLVQFLHHKGVYSAFYWAWNGNGWQTGGVLQPDWHTIRKDKISLLKRLWSSP